MHHLPQSIHLPWLQKVLQFPLVYVRHPFTQGPSKLTSSRSQHLRRRNARIQPRPAQVTQPRRDLRQITLTRGMVLAAVQPLPNRHHSTSRMHPPRRHSHDLAIHPENSTNNILPPNQRLPSHPSHPHQQRWSSDDCSPQLWRRPIYTRLRRCPRHRHHRRSCNGMDQHQEKTNRPTSGMDAKNNVLRRFNHHHEAHHGQLGYDHNGYRQLLLSLHL